MSGESYVLDTSAMLALVEDEPGADRVEELLKTGRGLLPWLVLLELTYVTRQEKGESEAEYRYALAKALPVEILWSADEATMLTAARYKASYKISLADAIIAAFATRWGAILVHKDPEYEALEGELRLEALPYKTADRR